MDEELDNFIEWLRVLKLPEEDFRRHIRGYFDDTDAMNIYIERRAPQEAVRYAYSTGDEQVSLGVPTRPSQALSDDTQDIPLKTGHYKGKRRKR
jgi:hypothetical protein